MTQASTRHSGGRQIRSDKGGKNTLLIGGLVVATLVIVVVAGLALTRQGAPVGEQVPNMGANLHIQNPDDPLPTPYNSNPPTSGYHYGGGTAPWGIHTQPIDDKLTVHNLEHGGVAIYYSQSAAKGLVDQLATVARELQQRSPCIIMMPRAPDQIDAPIVMTAWNWKLKLQEVDAKAIRSFFEARINQGPEQVGCGIR